MSINNTMANKFQKFLGDMAIGFLAPKGNMADFQHAARLYTDHTFRLAPKNKFLYYVLFNINPDALDNISFEDKRLLELNYLVKSADLPKYTMKTETLNQYNRKTNVYTGITYDPVSITLHDDNSGVTNLLWALYYGYYFADRGNTGDPDSDISPAAYDRNTYSSKNRIPFRYGLDNDSDEPFFNSVQLFTLSKQRFYSYLLCNPKITKWDHDGVDQSSGNGILENKMTLAYDAVIYNTGRVQEDEPAGFAVLHYDRIPSPIAGAENIQNMMEGIFGDDFSLNSFGGGGLAGGLVGGLLGGLVKGLAGGASPYTNTGNRMPYGYGQPSFLNGGMSNSMSGLQQYGFGGGAVPLAALTVAGVGLAVNTVGNVISGVGSLFSSSGTDTARAVEAPNGEAPAAEDAFTPPTPVARPKEVDSVPLPTRRPAEEAAKKEADNPATTTSVAEFDRLDQDPSTAESSPGKGTPAPGDDMDLDYKKYPDTGKPPLMPPSTGEEPAARATSFSEDGAY